MRLRGNLILVSSVFGAFGIFLACGSNSGGSDFANGNDASGDAISNLESGPGFAGDGATGCNPCSDFPAAPIIDGPSDAGASAVAAAPPNSATLFGVPDTSGDDGGSGGPCVFEPEVGTLFPNNWLRPSFAYVPFATQNLFEIRLHTAKETNDLVVYTRSTRWSMPKTMWTALAANVQNEPITMTVRGAAYDDASGAFTAGPVLGSSGDISIAPAQALGSIVYWVTSTASLKGFQIGDEGVTDVVTPAQDDEPDAGLTVGCIGCHSSAGNGKYVLPSSAPSAGSGVPAWISIRSSDGLATEPDPSIVSFSAAQLLVRETQQLPSSSAAHFQPGDRLIISNYNPSNNEIIWTDLEATSTAQYSGTGSYAGTGWGVFARNGDLETDGVTPRQGGQAAPSHDGTKIAYVSANSMNYGVAVLSNDGDIKTIPFNSRQGGTATPVLGASDPAYSEFYPIYSPNDKVLAFGRVPAGGGALGNGDNYANPATEVFVVPSAGAATATRLSANDPPSCLAQPSPGVSNSWPKWAPNATDVGGKTYYWLVFSTLREFGHPQLYLTAVVVDDATGAIDASHAALRIWNQPETEHNHTPAWDFFSVPPSGPR